jgi:FMN phosphatase YigB (HAD superfamily)
MKGDYTFEQNIEMLAEELQFDEGTHFQELVKSCQRLRFVSPEVPELVRSLCTNGTIVVIATDNMDNFSRWTVPAMGLADIFDEILNSHDLGGLKRDKEEDGRSVFFSDFLQRRDVLPSECLLIDDGGHNGPVVRGFGIRFCQIERGIGLVPELKRILANLRL